MSHTPAHKSATSSEPRSHGRTEVAIWWITFLNSIGTGVLWNGLGFVTQRDLKFSEVETTMLFLASGGVYTIAALASGRTVRTLSRRMSPRSLLVALLLLQAAASPLVYIGIGSVGIVLTVLVTSATGALLWPIVESYVSGGRSGDGMRRAIGRWCIVWMAAVSAALLLMAPLMRHGAGDALDARFAVFAVGPLSLVSMLALPWVPRMPGAHVDEHAPVPPGYRAQLASARVLLPASYLLVGALSPVLPYVLTSIDVAPAAQTPLTATWLIVRLGAVAMLAHVAFWHGRWSSLFVGGALLASGFALVVAAPALWSVTVGLSLFGIGHGVIYYAALYYALRVGSAGVDAGGTHEALIGVGYVAGPGAAMAGALLGGGPWIVGTTWICLGVLVVPAVLPWWREIRARRATPATPEMPASTPR
jgi:hypothetical protein